MANIAIIGGGWVGCMVALMLRKQGHTVTIYEKNSDVFQGISGKYGLRIHLGPHYPRSERTRQSCQDGLKEFLHDYPELLVHLEHAIYALGTEDVDGNPSKVSAEVFEAVCRESEAYGAKPIDPTVFGYTNLNTAFDMDEPSGLVGDRLREVMKRYLMEAGVEVKCNCSVQDIKNVEGKYSINGEGAFDNVVNATYYQSLLPSEPLPFDIETVYQPCLTLRYKDKQAGEKPFSLTVMDGMFACLMPREDHVHEPGVPIYREYTLYHAKYTILDSCKTVEDAQKVYDEINNAGYDNFIQRYKPLWEQDFERFYPGFKERFEFVGTDTGIAAKLKTDSDFRTAVTFKKDDQIYVFSGKVNNVFDAANEIVRLIDTKESDLDCSEGYYFLKDGEFARSKKEMREKPKSAVNTTTLHTMDFIRSSGLLRSESPAVPVAANKSPYAS